MSTCRREFNPLVEGLDRVMAYLTCAPVVAKKGCMFTNMFASVPFGVPTERGTWHEKGVGEWT